MYIAFDIGNVICNVDFTNFLNLLSKYINITTDEAFAFLGRIQRSHDLGISYLKDELVDHFQIRSHVILNELLEAWNKSIKINDEMVKLLNRLLFKGYNIALVSNIGFEHAELMRKKILIPRLIKGEITEYILDNEIKTQISGTITEFFSCDVGARKPSLLYYNTFLSIYPEFKECIYVDDLIENINIGNKFGLRSVQFDLSKYNSAAALQCTIESLDNIKI